jgi:hypothetical protein
MPYAEKTTVAPEKSRAEIEALLRKYGADGFMSGWGKDSAFIAFHAHDRMLKFVLPLPLLSEDRFWKGRGWRRRTEAQAEAAHEQEIRRRFRALALVIKAKLEAVESKVASFESEFMAHIVMPDGKTVADHVSPAIAAAYRTGGVPRLLPEFTA